MKKESYIFMLETFGFKRAFKDEHFETLLESMQSNETALREVQKTLSKDLKEEGRKANLGVVSYEKKGEERVTLHYTQDKNPKKMYFSKQGNIWKIDFKAGRKKEG